MRSLALIYLDQEGGRRGATSRNDGLRAERYDNSRGSRPARSRTDWQVIDKATSPRAMIRAGELGTAELWAVAYSGSEAWGAWGGAQPSPPGSPGSVPAIYDSNQNVQNTDVVLWYIAHVSSRDLVATCGPWLKLVGY